MPCARQFRELCKGLIDLALPPVCAVCGDLLRAVRQRDVICRACWSRVRELPHPQCSRCGYPLRSHSVLDCRWCRLLPQFVSSARSVCWVTPGTGGDIVHALKYEGWTRVAAGIG